jgi:NADP-dependent 3-hydroxy acid dehydrogenase YdfG
MNRIALITGASSGIGYATANLLAQNEYHLILVARRKDKLEKIQTELQNNFQTKVCILAEDIRNTVDLRSAIEKLPEEWKHIQVLINNAGLGLAFDSVDEAKLEDWETMLDTNVKSLISVTHILLPYLLKTEDAHIINIGSTAAKQVKKGSSVYSATKFAVEAFTKGLRIDLLDKGVKVTQINPGVVETEFALVKAKGNKELAEKSYSNFTPLYPDDVADAILFALSRPKHVNINDILLTTIVEADINTRIDKIIE